MATLAFKQSGTADEQRVKDPNIVTGNGDPNYNWLWLLLAAVVVGGLVFWNLLGGKEAYERAQRNNAIKAEVRAFCAEHPFMVNGQPVAFKKDAGGGGDDWFDFGEDIPDFNAEEQQKLMDQIHQFFFGAAWNCRAANGAGNPGAACPAIAQLMNAAHKVIEQLHPMLLFPAHAAYCLQLEELAVCCDIPTLKKYGLICGCEGMTVTSTGTPAHAPYRPFSAN